MKKKIPKKKDPSVFANELLQSLISKTDPDAKQEPGVKTVVKKSKAKATK